jgi:CubicO group peptidase (beta-lactamase class C family)
MTIIPALNFKFNRINKAATIIMMLLFCYCSNLFSQESIIQALKNQVDQVRQDAGISAALVIVVDSKNVIINQPFGVVDWQNKDPFDSTHRFRIGSVSKSFAGLLALRMQQQGIINLQDRLDKYISSEFIQNNFNENPITLEQLLEHTAGFSDLTKAEWDYNNSKPISIDQALTLKKGNHKSLWPPGQHSSYSNVGAAYLGLALEKASDKSYEKLMQEFVFKPLGMKSSNLLLTHEVQQKLITGYNTDGKSPIPYWHNIYRPFAAINTDAYDMIVFLQLLLNQGRQVSNTFLSEVDIKRFETPHTTISAQNGLNYGYGLGNYQWQTDGYDFHGHGGDADGYLTRYAYNRESGKAYFIMINAFQHQTLKSIQEEIESFIIKDLAKPKNPTRIQLKAGVLNSYIGKYAQETKRSGGFNSSKPSMEIYQKDHQLYLKRSGYSDLKIFAVNQHHFRFVDESKATMAFVIQNNKVFLQGDFGNFIKQTP